VFGHDSGYAASTQNLSQVTLNSDNVFGDGWDAELAKVTGDPASGMTVALRRHRADCVIICLTPIKREPATCAESEGSD